MDDFAEDITAWASETQDWIGETTVNEARELFNRVIDYSPKQGIAPFSTGHFLHNWRISSAPSYTEIEGTATSSQKKAEINNFLHDDYFFMSQKVYLTNATSYAGNVELAGWKITGPYEPVQKAFLAADAPVTKAFASIL